MFLGFPGGLAGKEFACNVGDLDLSPGLGRSPGERNVYPLRYFGLENSTDCVVHGFAKSRTWLSDFHFTIVLLLSSRSAVSDPWQPHRLQHIRLLCPLLSPRICSNSCPLSQWCYLTIPSSAARFCCLQFFPSLGSFPMSLTLHFRWPKYWSFNFSPSNEYSGFISFKIDWFDLLAVQGILSLKASSPAPQFESINSLALSLLYDPTLTSIHDYCKNHSLDYRALSAMWCLCFLICFL